MEVLIIQGSLKYLTILATNGWYLLWSFHFEKDEKDGPTMFIVKLKEISDVVTCDFLRG